MIHGYKHPVLSEAIKRQVDLFSHVMLAGLSHQAVEDLAYKLETWLPGDLNYSFFSDSGSVAVEVALKMALQFYVNQGIFHRKKVLSLTHAYHGDTFKTMEVGDDEDYHYILKFCSSSFDCIHIPTEISALEEAFALYGGELNSFIVEPLLQGAGGMRMYDVAFLKRARELCDAYGVLLIFDEVATGFGRTGNRFVADLVLPDILCLGKALTGGYIGHAATVANEKVYRAFYDSDPQKALMHGPTFMGNPLACAVALKSIEVFENENYLMINYLFKERKELKNYNFYIIFIHYFCRSIYNDSNFYLLNYEIFDSSLDFLEKLTDNCNKAQMQEIFDCENYKFLEILNNYYKYRIIPNSTDKNSEIDHIKKLLKICNNIIDAGLNFALGVVFSQFFDNLVIFFSKNLNNRRILENFLNTFIRLLGHYDKKIADNLFKRGIINECIFCYFLRGCNLNNCPFNEEIIAKMFKIISDYLQIVFGKNQESKLKREDYLLLHNFKEFIKNTDIISEETRVCLLHLDYMNMI